MAFVYADRVQETSTTTGTGTYNLAGVSGTEYQTFVAGIGTTNTCYYCATMDSDYEIGIGTVTDATPDTLARTTILQSSNADAAVNWGAGTKTIFCTIPAVATWDIGDIKATARASASAGWLMAYGQAISRTTYAVLFAEISTTYGVGDGSTTFNVPDLRGRVIAGQDDMGGSSANRLTSPIDGDTLGASGGAESHTLDVTEIPAHTHDAQYASVSSAGSAYEDIGARSDDATPLGITTSSTGGGGAHNNVQPTIILNYMIFAGV